MSAFEYRLLTEEEIADALGQLPGWVVEEGELTKTYEFANYKDGLVFALAVGHLADRLDHHPVLMIGYQRVNVSMSTHAVEGLSPWDVELARQIESIA